MTAVSLQRIVADALADVGVTSTPVQGRPRATTWSTKQPGFGVRHYASGRQVYVVQAPMHGVTRTVTLCNANLIGERAALDLARRILLRAQVGEDPAAQRKRARSAPTFARFLDDYWRRVSPGWKPATLITNDKYRRLYLNRAFAGRGIDEIGEEEAVRWFVEITRRGSPGAANRTLSILCAMFNKAIEWGKRPAGTNPTSGVRRNRGKVIERHLSDAELERLGAVLDDLRADWPIHVAAVQLLLLTGCRHAEIIGLQWSEFHGRRLLLTDSKTGPRTVWLGDAARTILDALPRPRGASHVFHDERRGRPVSLSWLWAKVKDRAGFGGVRLHDLRHSFASHAAARSETLPMIGKLLGHAKIASTARYAHLDDSVLAQAAEKIGTLIAAAIGEAPLTPIAGDQL